jgi:pyruvate, water dikinase
MKHIIALKEIGLQDIATVGGKNASLGEMIRNLELKGIRVPDGFATSARAYRDFISRNNLEDRLRKLMQELDLVEFSNLHRIASSARALILEAQFDQSFKQEVSTACAQLNQGLQNNIAVAVRSSATAEDLPGASFAGLHDSFLNINGTDNILDAIRKCYASLYNARAIKYRIDHGFKHEEVALSACVQAMVRADMGCSGVCFTIDPDSGFRNSIVINATWGLGENIVQGTVVPDEYYLFKPFLGKVSRSIFSKKLGTKTQTMVYHKQTGTENIPTPNEKRTKWVLDDPDILQLAVWAEMIETHYGRPMDIEWAKDGISGLLYIVQARPETIHGEKARLILKEYTLNEKGTVLLSGSAVGTGIRSGRARILQSPAEADQLQTGEILVTDTTNPDWDPVLKKAGAIITNKGGRTSHAAIVAREMGALALVGSENATQTIKDGDLITLDNSQGKYGYVYEGKLSWDEKEINLEGIRMPSVQPMLILADPDKAFVYSQYPSAGVGLMRMEFVISHSIQIHPMALVNFERLQDPESKQQIETLTKTYADKKEYFIDRLSQAIGTIAAAFFPREVIVRMSDFKSNEYADLIGGKNFEEPEENPMIGFRGASRYDHEKYRAGFKLECEAIKRVRNEMGFTNVKLMIPFCRTLEEGRKVIRIMADYGLKQGSEGLEIYVMAEIPSNVILAEGFAEIFDGFSIGSNDLTQLTLGIDRDSSIISDLFNENDEAVKYMIASVIRAAKKSGSKIGLCGQAPSDDSSFAAFLIEEGIDSISFNPDALIRGIENMHLALQSNKNEITIS